MNTWCLSDVIQVFQFLSCSADPVGIKARLLEIHGIGQMAPHGGRYHFFPELVWSALLQKEKDCQDALEKRRIGSAEELSYRLWDWQDENRRRYQQGKSRNRR